MANTNKQDKASEKSIPSPAPTAPHAPEADTHAVVVPALVHFALDVAERGHRTVFGALHDARTELRVAIDGGLDWTDKTSAAALRFARKLVQRGDDLAAETLGGAERVLSSTVASAREGALAAAARLATARASTQLAETAQA